MDIVEANIKRANEKKRKWDAIERKKSKHFVILKNPLSRKTPVNEDQNFKKVGEGRFRKVYS